MRTLRFAIVSCMRAQTIRQLARITWENFSLVHITFGWLFDGAKQSPASFTRCSWRNYCAKIHRKSQEWRSCLAIWPAQQPILFPVFFDHWWRGRRFSPDEMTRWRCSLQNTGSGKGEASSSNGKEKGGGRGGRREKETEQKGHRTQVRAMARFLFSSRWTIWWQCEFYLDLSWCWNVNMCVILILWMSFWS